MMVFTVSELNRHIRQSLEPLYPDIWVEGEISNVRIPASGHCYFTLKDNASQIRAVLFRLQSRALLMAPEEGMHVLCRGSISVYEPRGEYQMIVSSLEPHGIGALQRAFEQLKHKLAQEGLFDAARKKPLPMLPAKIAVISSPTGAVVHDIIRIVQRRCNTVAILVVPVRVQGAEAPDEIVDAIETVNRLRCADVIILARGGGSLEDLQPFNTEKVARAIAASTLPVISAIGHETDVTIADFVADLRAPTPSAAAELVVRDKKELFSLIGMLDNRMHTAINRHIARQRDLICYHIRVLSRWPQNLATLLIRQDELAARLSRALRHVVLSDHVRLTALQRILRSRSPHRICQAEIATLSHTMHRLRNAIRTFLLARANHVAQVAGRLSALSPAAILDRGFSITRLLPSMTIVRSSDVLQPGDMVRITLSRGSIDCLVKRVVQ
ncbi:MAG: exodeoxyribonuclease VII large subunit [Desulfobacterota bacterium]|nr:exodeoxyribonuclease VII large subunit [Thermodesulfobacteriota bacterium]